jgi:hypothetical protein
VPVPGALKAPPTSSRQITGAEKHGPANMIYMPKTPQASISVSENAIQFKYGPNVDKPKSGLKTVVRQPNPTKRKAVK